jgi:hypothetical protein
MSHCSIMQDPTDQTEAYIPTRETVTNGPNRSGILRLKATKRTEPSYLASPPPPKLRRITRYLVLPLPPPPPPQDEDIPARKKPRLETPTIAIAMALPSPADVDDDDVANTK